MTQNLILAGEPFDQAEVLPILVNKLKAKGFHLIIYICASRESCALTLEEPFTKNSEVVNGIFDSMYY